MASVSTIAVIGAGNMGRAIAFAAASAGYHTILEDLIPSALRRAEDELRTHLKDAVQSGALSRAAAEIALDRLKYADTIEEAVRAADLVIEVVPDEMESKLEIFTLLDKICRPATVLVSTTTSFSLSEIASVTYRPDRCAGMRFSHENTQQRLEVVRGSETNEETVAMVMEVARYISREASLVEEIPRLEGSARL